MIAFSFRIEFQWNCKLGAMSAISVEDVLAGRPKREGSFACLHNSNGIVPRAYRHVGESDNHSTKKESIIGLPQKNISKQPMSVGHFKEPLGRLVVAAVLLIEVVASLVVEFGVEFNELTSIIYTLNGELVVRPRQHVD